VFIDDLKANVVGALAAGLQAIHYREPAKLKLDLRALGIEP